MGVRLLESPAIEPVSLELAKQHLRVENDDSNDLIQAYISAARLYIENWSHTAVAEARWMLTLDAFPSGAISIPNPPLIAVESVECDDADGVARTLVEDVDYFVDASGKFGWIVPVSTGWPSTISAVNSVRVTFRAGYQMSADNEVPIVLQQAILLLVGQYFDNREAMTTAGTPSALPFGMEGLISPYRVPVLA